MLVEAAALQVMIDDVLPTERLNAALLAAQTAVGTYLLGPLGSLDSGEEVSETVSLRFATTSVALAGGPATALVQVIWNEKDVTARAKLNGLYGLKFPAVFPTDDLSSGISGVVSVRYTQGWTDATKAPTPIKQAILLTAVTLAGRPDMTITGERAGDFQTQYVGADALSPATRAMLRGYRQPALLGV